MAGSVVRGHRILPYRTVLRRHPGAVFAARKRLRRTGRHRDVSMADLEWRYVWALDRSLWPSRVLSPEGACRHALKNFRLTARLPEGPRLRIALPLETIPADVAERMVASMRRADVV